MSDTESVCERCGEEFDPEREPEVPGADTSRCPACGAKPIVELSETDENNGEVVVGADGLKIELHLHVHRVDG